MEINEWTNLLLYKYLGYDQNHLTLVSSFAARTTNAATSRTQLLVMTILGKMWEKEAGLLPVLSAAHQQRAIEMLWVHLLGIVILCCCQFFLNVFSRKCPHNISSSSKTHTQCIGTHSYTEHTSTSLSCGIQTHNLSAATGHTIIDTIVYTH